MGTVRAAKHEKLSNENIAKVVSLLSGDSPITKKEACEILNIRYNTTPLQKISLTQVILLQLLAVVQKLIAL